MKRKRGPLEIARDLLEVAKYGARPTALVYGANLNFNIIKKYLKEMEENGLIHVETLDGVRSRLYTPTESGLAFMDSVSRTLDLYRGTPPAGVPPELIQDVLE